MFQLSFVLNLHQIPPLTFFLDFHGHGWELSYMQPQVIWTGVARKLNCLKYVIIWKTAQSN